MTVERNDISRLLSEMVGTSERLGGMEEWLVREQISEEAFAHLIERMLVSLVEVVSQEDFTPAGALGAGFATSFQIGWEAHKQYGHAHS